MEDEDDKIFVCHPNDIQKKANQLVGVILQGGNRDETPLANIKRVCEVIYADAIRNPYYSRTIALIVECIIKELEWRRHDLRVMFQSTLAHMAKSRFLLHWRNPKFKSLDDNALSSPEVLLEKGIAISNFTADLFAVGVVLNDAMEICISYLLDQCNASIEAKCAYILLIRANSYRAPTLNSNFLKRCHGKMVPRVYLHKKKSKTSRYFKNILVFIHSLQVGNNIKSRKRHEWDRNMTCEACLIFPITPLPLAKTATDQLRMVD